MIEKVELYNVRCDKCLDYLYNEDDTVMCFDEECLARQVAEENGWVFNQGYLHCPSCAEKIEEDD